MSEQTDPANPPVKVPRRRMPRLPGQVVNCGWCGKFVAVPLRGRVPKPGSTDDLVVVSVP